MTYVEVKRKDVEKILKATFPHYRGRKIKVCCDYFPKNLNSYWDGGSKTYYSFYNLKDGRVLDVGSNHPFFEADKPRVLSFLPQGVLLVANVVFCGKDLGIRIYVNTEDMPRLLE